MSFFNSIDIAGSGLTATRLRMDTISENVANAETTRTEQGGAYRRKAVVYQALDGSSFKSKLYQKLGYDENETAGVKVVEIVEDQSDMNYVYDPTHPDADEDGYVEMPNVNPTQEVLDMMAAKRAYQNNLSAIDAMKQMGNKALEIGR